MRHVCLRAHARARGHMHTGIPQTACLDTGNVSSATTSGTASKRPHARLRAVALGMAKVTGGEVMYDQRLFNQDQGMGTGFGADDAYGVYDKQLFADRRWVPVGS